MLGSYTRRPDHLTQPKTRVSGSPRPGQTYLEHHSRCYGKVQTADADSGYVSTYSRAIQVSAGVPIMPLGDLPFVNSTCIVGHHAQSRIT